MTCKEKEVRKHERMEQGKLTKKGDVPTAIKKNSRKEREASVLTFVCMHYSFSHINENLNMK